MQNHDISMTEFRLYCVIRKFANIHTRAARVKINTLAAEINRSHSTVQRSLNSLIRAGVIERVFNKSPNNSKQNEASTFILHDEYFEPTESAKMRPGWSQNRDPNIRESRTTNNIKEKNYTRTINREAQLPRKSKISEKKKETTQSISEELFDKVPDILHTTARYLLQNTGRSSLAEYEIEPLKLLFEKHTPVRIQKLIDEKVEYFKAKGKSLTRLTFNYIWACLKDQRSLRTQEEKAATSERRKARKRKQKAENTVKDINTPEPHVEVELIMPVEEAERIIAEGIPEPSYDPLLDKIKAKQDGLEERMSVLDYLKLKFPDEDEEVLRNQSHLNQVALKNAFLVDYICARCNGEGKCENLCGHNHVRPIVDIFEFDPGDKRLRVINDRVNCRFIKKRVQKKPNFEKELQKIGAKPNQTFENYKALTPELKVAEALAILATRDKKSLILAGKAGTGKTHLATAIAIEAVKSGRQAIVKNVPEMLDELRQAARGNNDFFFDLQKYKDVPCLVLDDLGKERTTKAGLDYLYQIIDYRYRYNRQTIITTNALAPEGLYNPWNVDVMKPIISRILEKGEWVTITDADDYRTKNKTSSEEKITASEVPAAETLSEEARTEAEVEPAKEKKSEISEDLKKNEVETLPEDKTSESAEVLPEEKSPASEVSATETLSEEKKCAETEKADVKIMPKEKITAQELSEEKTSEPTEVLPEKESPAGEEPTAAKTLPEFLEPPEAKIKTMAEIAANMSSSHAPVKQKSWEEISLSMEYRVMSEYDKILTHWEYYKGTPEYKNLSDYDKGLVQVELVNRLAKADKHTQGCLIPAPPIYDDGLDDDEGDIRL